MTHADDKVSQAICALLTVGVAFVFWQWGADARVLVTLLLLLPLISMGLVLVRLGEMRTAALRVAAGAFGPLYLGGGMASLALLRRDAGADGPSYVLLTFMLSWFSDTGAYFAGRFLGKHKLYRRSAPRRRSRARSAASPRRSSAARCSATMDTCAASRSWTESSSLSSPGPSAEAGDLGESLLKRSVGVKDSGASSPATAASSIASTPCW